MNTAIPRMCRARQIFPPPAALNIQAITEAEARKLAGRVRPGARIAVAVGSRGITNLQTIVQTAVATLKSLGATPFIIPAMGSHGGATPEGQQGVLEEYGITTQATGAPIRPSLEVELLDRTQDGAEVFCSIEALRSEGVLLINRVKPHTDFKGSIGSGLIKMMAIGLGKRSGAAACHVAASRFGHEKVILEAAAVILRKAPILGGLAILEDQTHHTAKIEFVPAEHIFQREPGLLLESAALMPRLPFDEIDLLIIDRIGKNISGAGMDPNIINRPVNGYSSSLMRDGHPAPFIRRIFVRGLTKETKGNAIGIGFADITTTRLVEAMNKEVTYINALTSLTPHSAKIPIHSPTDKQALQIALPTLALEDCSRAKVARIRDTLSLDVLEISEALAAECGQRPDLQLLTTPREMPFDETGNLADLDGD